MSPFKVASEAVLVACIVVIAGFWGIWREFSDRIPPRAHIGTFAIGGIRISDVPGVVRVFEQEFLVSSLTVQLRGKDSRHSLAELGITLDADAAVRDISTLQGRFMPLRRVRVVPQVHIADPRVQQQLEKDFEGVLSLPKNPTLTVRPDYSVTIVPGTSGERLDILSLHRDMARAVTVSPYHRVLASAIRAVPQEDPVRLEALRAYAEHMLQSGFALFHREQQFQIPKPLLASMIRFTGIPGQDVAFEEEKLAAYLTKDIAPMLYREPVNARFEVQDGRVSQFALPQDGEQLDVPLSIKAVQRALASHTTSATLAVTITSPAITDVDSTQSLGITSLLARGESDYKGSPKNRMHNIATGAARYHGLLIAPGQEFSFNEFLGPVTAEAGFKPELVIKNNVTTPEFGGGLCQVSTTIFRAAVHSGMKITSRRNHSYAVRYYGTPGFDATIYPPYTDFRFLNNTPGYLLVQTKIDGTRLSFELWGTDDGRSVTVDGPHPYDKQANGAVKATLKQTVVRNGETLIEDTFRSNYKSPALFPHIRAANGET